MLTWIRKRYKLLLVPVVLLVAAVTAGLWYLSVLDARPPQILRDRASRSTACSSSTLRPSVNAWKGARSTSN